MGNQNQFYLRVRITRRETYADVLSGALNGRSVRRVCERVAAVGRNGFAASVASGATDEVERHIVRAMFEGQFRQLMVTLIDKHWLDHVQLVVPILRLRLEREVRRILVRGVVPQGKLDRTAVHTRVFAVVARVVGEPGDTTEELPVDGCRALRVTVGLVEEDGPSRAAPVGHLLW